MTNYQSPLPDYNPDGSMNPHVRDRFRKRGLTEEEIDHIEEVNMRHVRVERECAECEEEHRRYSEEWSNKRKAEAEERERLGIKPTWKITYSSPDRIDPKSLNPAKRRAYEISGLSIEERLSQGYNDLDDLVDDSDEIDNDSYLPENPPPEIPF